MSRRHATLAQQVAETLRASIRAGEYVCGERMIELAIAHSQGVSQNTVREALRQLEHEGWVRYTARRGVRVRQFDADEVEEIFVLMATVERQALEWAFEECSRADLLDALGPPLYAAREYHALGLLAERRESLFAFHAALTALTERPRTIALLRTLHNQALLATVDFERHGDSTAHHAAQIDGYEHLLGVLKFGTSEEAQAALHARVVADARPIVRWLAMHE